MVALLIGVFLVMASRTHYNQMVVSATGARHTYSAMNVIYQVAYLVVQLPTGMFADRLNSVTMLAIIVAGLAITLAASPFALIGLSTWSWTPFLSAIPALVTGALYAVNGALAGSWWPFMNVMLSNWAPPEKLAYMYSTINTGIPGGIVVGNMFTGFFYAVQGTDFGYSFFVISVSIFLCTLCLPTKAVLEGIISIIKIYIIHKNNDIRAKQLTPKCFKFSTSHPPQKNLFF